MLGLTATKHDRPSTLPKTQLVEAEVCERLSLTAAQLQLARSAAGFPAASQIITTGRDGVGRILLAWRDEDVDRWADAVRELAKALR